MIVSESRLAANRANALRSTGPRTAEGKERSRCNAVKHGLTGEGVAICSEEAEAIEARFLAYLADYRPATEVGRDHVRRAAMLAVRIERSAIQEAAAISLNVRAAEARFDEAREDEVDALFEMLAENPAKATRKLIRMPEGLDRMLDTWADLRQDLTRGDGSRWDEERSAMAVRLTGRKAGGFGVADVEALARGALGDFTLLNLEDGAGLDPAGRREWARWSLVGLIDLAMGKLEAVREGLDYERIEADRAGAGARALFDSSKEAILARKYEAAAEREMRRAIAEMKAVEAEAAERGQPRPPLGSFSPPPSHRPLGAGFGSRFEPISGRRGVELRRDEHRPDRKPADLTRIGPRSGEFATRAAKAGATPRAGPRLA